MREKFIQKTGFRKILIYGMLLILVQFFVLMSNNISAQAADTYTIKVVVPGNDTFTLEMPKTDCIGCIKFRLQDKVDIDLNKMDLLYNGKILTEVKRFSSGIVPDGATVTMQTSNRWNYDEVKGVDDLTFSIARPKEESLTKIYAKNYGMSPGNVDNTKAFTDALKDCTSNAYLVIEKGTYYFREMTDDIAFNNMENVIIDGNDSTFIFDTKYCMKIYGGNGVEIRNLKVNWDWDTIPVGSLVQIDKKVSDTEFDIRFIGVDEVDADIPIGTFWYLDPDNLTIGTYGKYKAFTPGKVGGPYLKKVEKIDKNVLRITHTTSEMKHFNEGEYYLLRHFEYSGRVFGIARYAKNITFDNVSIYGFTGMGWVFADRSNHFQVINSYLGLDPNGPKERRIATAADAIHILNTGGYFRIDNCDLGFTGDDIINIHDDIMGIMSIDESRTTIRGWATSGFIEPGDKVRFFNNQLSDFTDYEATITSFTTDTTKVDSKGNKYERIVTFSEPLPEEITTDCYVHNVSSSTSYYVVSNNYIHEARARAALLNDDYGLFENNHIYRIVSGAIQMRASVSPGRWMEGDGANHVVARNNLFEKCNFGAGESIVNIGVKVDDTESSEIILNDIRIENNIFLNCVHKDEKQVGVVYANNVDNIVITGNVMIDSGDIYIGDAVGKRTITNNDTHSEHVFEKNEKIDANKHKLVCKYCRYETEEKHKFSNNKCTVCGYEKQNDKPNPPQEDKDPLKAFASRMYTVVLNRTPDSAGLDFWVEELLSGKRDGASIASGFICSKEFTDKNLSDEEYVNVLYRTFFDREAEAAGKAYWINVLSEGQPRTKVLAGFVNSNEFGSLCESYGIARGTMDEDGSSIYNANVREFVLRNYTKVLQRNGELNGVENWCYQINKGNIQPVDVARSFFYSEEFIKKNLNDEDYVETLYETFFGRGSDADGKAYWLKELKNGKSREETLDGFAYSPEFAEILKSFGL